MAVQSFQGSLDKMCKVWIVEITNRRKLNGTKSPLAVTMIVKNTLSRKLTGTKSPRNDNYCLKYTQLLSLHRISGRLLAILAKIFYNIFVFIFSKE